MCRKIKRKKQINFSANFKDTMAKMIRLNAVYKIILNP
jgi:hypothetical protein